MKRDPLVLRSCVKACWGREPERTNFTGNILTSGELRPHLFAADFEGTLDYIFATEELECTSATVLPRIRTSETEHSSSDIACHLTSDEVPALSVIGRRYAAAHACTGPFPSVEWPSDHYLVSVDVTIRCNDQR
jgi:mRNA deadenylase 3'-5' endonuclease subunit Ccr4